MESSRKIVRSYRVLHKQKPRGVIVAFVVDDCDSICGKAQELGANILQTPKDMPYGQRRMLVQDTGGTILDISAPTALLA